MYMLVVLLPASNDHPKEQIRVFNARLCIHATRTHAYHRTHARFKESFIIQMMVIYKYTYARIRARCAQSLTRSLTHAYIPAS